MKKIPASPGKHLTISVYAVYYYTVYRIHTKCDILNDMLASSFGPGAINLVLGRHCGDRVLRGPSGKEVSCGLEQLANPTS